MSFKQNWPIYLGYAFLAPILATGLYFGYQNDKEHWQRYHNKQKPVTMKELCYDKASGEEVRLMPLDIQQINSRAGRNFDGLWNNLECRLVTKEN